MKLLATIISLCIFIALFLISTSKTVQGSQNLTSSISRVMSKKRKDPHESLNLSVDEIFFGDIGKIYREAQGYNSTFNCISQDNKNSSSKLSIVQNSHDKNNSKTTDESQDLISTFNNTSSIQSLSVQNVNNKNMSKGILKAQEMTSKLNLILLNRELDSCKNDKIQNISNTILNKLNKNMDSLFDERYYKASDVYMSSNVRRDYIYFEEMYDRIPFLHGLEIIYKGSIKIWEKNKSNLEEKIILALTKFDSKKNR
ncbi:hypothetical protein NAPIS_ORF02015 [Vairimorpha apis BRL 01]|uniref:Uncharacterized protein n=1 Tax=Vairimorpha apis BRL 01 TaxID=1037528 RepID=T0MAJ7_9MICR|nr:hypothetical protein NAPIS_ORF02015 [Vairimorpha apis BRL 01]